MTGFLYPVDGRAFPLAELTGRVDGYRNWSPVNSGSGNRALVAFANVKQELEDVKMTDLMTEVCPTDMSEGNGE